tara:strand:- start:2329 stop:2634 length:306 start_codon:yes stop_codon:yes gene_type:complete
MVDAETLTTGGLDAYQLIANYLGVSVATAVVILAILSIWSLIWKGFALWKSSQKKSIIWFIVLLVLNTMGILEILYIFVFSKIKLKKGGGGKGSTSKKSKN